ncbi:MAG: ornithine carbamoyltransferase, partial [Deltaproteobacteria bacterium]|nr:ornithine carbamoyltransferase [Deltaproteobacteria bacterium]
MPRHFLTVCDLMAEECRALFDRARWIKAQWKGGTAHRPLRGKTLALILEKPSTRTRVSFEVGMYQLGGHVVHLSMQDSQLGRGETYEDTARVLSRFVDGIVIRTFEQARVVAIANAANVPVINGLTDDSHP